MKKTKICSAEIDEVVNNPNETQGKVEECYFIFDLNLLI